MWRTTTEPGHMSLCSADGRRQCEGWADFLDQLAAVLAEGEDVKDERGSR